MRLIGKNRDFLSPKRILIIRQRGIGDVILSIPTIHTIKEHFNKSKIVLVLDTHCVDLFANDPYVDEIIEIRKNIWNLLSALWRIKCGGYSIVFDLISTPFSLLLSLLSGAKIRVGWLRPDRFRGRLYTHPVDITVSIPAISSNLRAVRCLGIRPAIDRIKIFLSDDEKERVKKKYFRLLSLDIKRLIVAIHPGNLKVTRKWFPERFAQLADLLIESGYQVVVTGSKDETEIKEAVKRFAKKDLSILPDLSLRDFACFLSSINLLVTNDGGVLHLSQAVGTKTLAIFGSTDPYIWFPYRIPEGGDFLYSDLDCSPCGRIKCDSLKCLKQIDVYDVFKKVKLLLKNQKAQNVSRET